MLVLTTCCSPQVPGQHDLTGGLLTSDHAKYAMPMSYTLTMLSWAMLKFPGAFVGREAGLLDTLRQGAEYLMRCDLSGGSGDGPLFVAQVGDGGERAWLWQAHKQET